MRFTGATRRRRSRRWEAAASGHFAQHARVELLLSLLASLDGLFPFDLARPGRPVTLELGEELEGDLGDVVHRVLAGLLVRLRERLEAAQLAHVLQRRSTNFLLGRGGLEVVQGFDVSAHDRSMPQNTAWARAWFRVDLAGRRPGEAFREESHARTSSRSPRPRSTRGDPATDST